ncbi:TonB protein C-terminal [Parapedobacter composti]|uniref:TonB protein C-terminal n=1 Tax=Parapedobacter composti TaxID=623281 RepID=A0A1I1I428_9SPHI|nr:energy transducer TonB [Parapedobacter composti]SFC31179.1 TonB protein C-terminal [Parapedobacter composti]
MRKTVQQHSKIIISFFVATFYITVCYSQERQAAMSRSSVLKFGLDTTIKDWHVDVNAVPPKGGMSAFMTSVSSNYKRNLFSSDLSGRVLISFIVGEDGEPYNFRILESAGAGTGEEGIRVITKLGKWSPALFRNRPAEVSFVIPIRVSRINTN